MVYKNPIVERDERIFVLEKEKAELRSELPDLKEKLKKMTKQLDAEQKDKAQKDSRVSRAIKITEHRVAEAIKSDYTFLTDNPQMISLLALFQERADFEVDAENDLVKPILEEGFLQVISQDINDISQLSELKVPMDMVKERVGEVKNKVLEGLKGRWIKQSSGGGGTRRNSVSSLVSSQSKRDRESLEYFERTNKQRTTSPSHSN